MLYGLASAALLSATLLWFTCYNTVMTSDKFIYLFGRVIPALSLVLSMTMRFVPGSAPSCTPWRRPRNTWAVTRRTAAFSAARKTP